MMNHLKTITPWNKTFTILTEMLSEVNSNNPSVNAQNVMLSL